MTELLSAALAYAARGWPILPLAPRGKRPYGDLLPIVDGEPSWTPLREGVDAAEIRRWFDHDPALNIGIITGRGMAVADVDIPSKLHGLGFPVTPMAQTGGPGRHHVYLDTHGLDVPERQYPWGHIKAGGYVVAPPSIHENGTPYEWYPYLSFIDVPLAPPPSALLESESAPSKSILSRCTFSASSEGLEGTWVSLGKGAYGELAGSWPVAHAILALCGVDVPRLGKAFRCPLPGHEERRPSAALWQPEGGFIGLHDFHARGEGVWWPLPDVYAACTTGTARKLGKGERVIWWLRALEDIGAITVPAMIPCRELPGDATKSTRKLYAGFVRLLALRAVYDPTQAAEAPFTWTFAQGWCGIASRHTVQKALTWLFTHSYLRRCGATPRGIGLLQLCDGTGREME